MIEGIAGIVIGVLISMGFDTALPSWSIGPSGTLIVLALLDELAATAIDMERKVMRSLVFKVVVIVATLRFDVLVESPIAQFVMIAFVLSVFLRIDVKFKSAVGVK